jgi:hypothetical protein
VQAGATGGGYNDALAMLAAQLQAKYAAAGLGDVIKPFSEYLYKTPGYAGAVAGAQEGAKYPYASIGRTEQSALDTARDRAKAILEAQQARETDAARQGLQAELDIGDYTVQTPDGGIAKVQMPRAEYLRQRQQGTPIAPTGGQMAPGATAPVGPLPITAPTVPGTNFAIGGGVPFQPAPMAPGAPAAAPGTPTAPAATGAPAGPAAAPQALRPAMVPQGVGAPTPGYRQKLTIRAGSLRRGYRVVRQTLRRLRKTQRRQEPKTLCWAASIAR